MNRYLQYLMLLLVTPAVGLSAFAQGFGGAVAVGSDEVVVGQTRNQAFPGTVYLYTASNGTWQNSAKIKAPGMSTTADGFGSAIALSDDLLAIGAPRANDGRGAVYVYKQNEAGAWTYATELSPDGEAEMKRFGHGVAIMHHHVIAGSVAATFVFDMDDAGNFTMGGRLTADSLDERSGFGASIAARSGMIYVGAPGYNDGAGSVFAYRHNHDNMQWEADGVMEGRGLDESARLGQTVFAGNGFVLAAAPRQGGFRGAGAVAVFRQGEDGSWNQDTQLAPIEMGPGAGFGSSIAGTDDEIWVGTSGDGGSGAVYIYGIGETGRFNSSYRMTGADLPERSGFGGGLAVHGDNAVVGLTGFDFGEGAATIFTRDGSAWSERATVINDNEGYASVTGGEVRCESDVAGAFPCNDVDMLSFLTVEDMGGARGVRANDIWGWTDPETGSEIAIVGRTEGTSFVDVSDANNPRFLGDLPKTEGSRTAIWRDMKVYKDHVFVVADGAGDHGIQIFDLRRLRGLDGEPKTFEEDAHYSNIHSAHNIVINEDTGFAFVVGASSGGETCGGGLHIVNIQNPTSPEFTGCFADPATGRRGTGYSHDAQCVTYSGPDSDFRGREICFGSNETALSIADVTDKAAPVALSSAAYPNVAYAHQGWLSEDQSHFYMNDEGDEGSGTVAGTRTLVWDVSDLEDPVLVTEYIADNTSVDHNLYVKGNLVYESNYVSGLRILDITDPANPVEVGFFDTVPYGENSGANGGSWSNYPYFKSGIVVVTSQREGLFVLKKRGIDI